MEMSSLSHRGLCRRWSTETRPESVLPTAATLDSETLNLEDQPKETQPGESIRGISQSANGSSKSRGYPLGVDIGNHHGVYFAGYTLPSPEDEPWFLQHWERAAEGVRDQKGFLYQELARQQPWEHELQAGEGSNPFDFVEYAIFEDMDDLRRAADKDKWQQGRAALREFQPRGEESGGVYGVAISVAREEPKEEEVVTFSLYEVPDRRTAHFVAAVSWPKRVEFQSSQRGFLSAILHQTDSEESKYRVFNRSEWESRQAFLDSEDLMEDAFPLVPDERRDAVRLYPGLFQVVRRHHGS